MLRLRPYKSVDSEKIATWVQDKDIYMKWGGNLIGDFPLTAEAIEEKYRVKNGDVKEADNFYPWVAFDDENG